MGALAIFLLTACCAFAGKITAESAHAAKSDLDVHYYLGTADKLELVNRPDFRIIGPGSRYTHLEGHPYAEGMLVIALFDPVTQAVVWRVTAV